MSLEVDDAPLRLHRLSYLPDGDDVVVGRTDVDSYGVFPRDGAELLKELAAGRAPAEAAEWYFRRYGTSVDMAEFLDTLSELDFLLPADARPTGSAEPLRWQRLGSAIFSAPAWICYSVLLLAAVAVCVADPELLPSRQHIFFSHYLLVVELTLFFGQIPLTLLHESFHALAGRRLGLRSRITIARRLYFVVAETAIDGLVVVPRRQRYLPMLAGMVADVLAVAGLTVLAYLTRDSDGSVSLVGAVSLALVFTVLLRFVWQFYFFLRTDIYHLVTTVLGCIDLHGTSDGLLRNWINRRLGRRDRLVDPDRWHPRDRRVARWYTPLHVVGYLVMIAVLVGVILPIGWQFLSTAVHTVVSETADESRFWDSAVLLVLNVGQLVLAAVLALRERLHHKR